MTSTEFKYRESVQTDPVKPKKSKENPTHAKKEKVNKKDAITRRPGLK